MYTPVQPRAADAARMVCRSLDAYLRGASSEGTSSEDDVPITVSRADVTEKNSSRTSDDDASAEVSCTVDLAVGAPEAGDADARAHFTVRHVGGNVYDVWGGFDEGRVQTFTCCLSDAPGIPIAPSVGRAVGSFLERELRSPAVKPEMNGRKPERRDNDRRHKRDFGRRGSDRSRAAEESR